MQHATTCNEMHRGKEDREKEDRGQTTKDRRQKPEDKRQEDRTAPLGAPQPREVGRCGGAIRCNSAARGGRAPLQRHVAQQQQQRDSLFGEQDSGDGAWLGKRAGAKDQSKELPLAAHLRTRVDLPPCTPQAETPRQTACHRSNTTKTSLTKPALAMLRRDFTPIKTSARYFVAHPWQPSAPTGSHPSGSIPSQAAAGLLLLLLPSASLE